jgi:hypothetical protein
MAKQQAVVIVMPRSITHRSKMPRSITHISRIVWTGQSLWFGSTRSGWEERGSECPLFLFLDFVKVKLGFIHTRAANVEENVRNILSQ